ncbi:uncharacterized protein PAC_18425 [Phialocephala subalpina]|uniref:Uncharacterized protein n=1 Tax=Phialocephala subalpina TaxID=576137 RepID=A0A1L7XU11_9HELO|nr:uncharacterized protein PAC_18425 [Phialocephala subalpina]
MSADRRWDQRRFQLEESTTLNGGARTISVEYIVLRGSMLVHSSTEADLDALKASAQQLEIGKKFTVKPSIYHKYRTGEEQTVLQVIVTSGDDDFESLLKILNGLDADGELGKMSDSVVLMVVIMGLSDAHLIGSANDMLEGAMTEKKDEIEALRRDLFAKYDTEEALQGLLIKAK